MNGYSQLLIQKCLRLVGAHDVNVAGRTELLDQLAGGIMVAVNEIDINAGVFEMDHLLIEEERRFKALKAGIVEVPGDDQEVNFFLDGGGQDFFEGAAGGVANLLDRSAGIVGQTLKGCIEMNVCAVDELHVGL